MFYENSWTSSQQIILYLEKYDILTLEQFGLRQDLSTGDATFVLLEQMFGVFCDLYKVFDCEYHGIILLVDYLWRGFRLNRVIGYLTSTRVVYLKNNLPTEHFSKFLGSFRPHSIFNLQPQYCVASPQLIFHFLMIPVWLSRDPILKNFPAPILLLKMQVIGSQLI